MAFWDNWFKVDCPECGKKLSKDELVPYEDRQVCADCAEALEEAAIAKQKEIEERRAAEEAARRALLDRPIDTSGKPFGASYDDVSGGGDSRF